MRRLGVAGQEPGRARLVRLEPGGTSIDPGGGARARPAAAPSSTWARWRPIEEQRLVAEAVLSTLWAHALTQREPCLVVIDEAHNICAAEPPRPGEPDRDAPRGADRGRGTQVRPLPPGLDPAPEQGARERRLPVRQPPDDADELAAPTSPTWAGCSPSSRGAAGRGAVVPDGPGARGGPDLPAERRTCRWAPGSRRRAAPTFPSRGRASRAADRSGGSRPEAVRSRLHPQRMRPAVARGVGFRPRRDRTH